MIYIKKKPKTKTQLAEFIKECLKYNVFIEKWISEYDGKHTHAEKLLKPNFEGIKKNAKK